MATTKSRLDQIEGELTPMQMLFVWLEKLQTFSTMEDYVKWAVDHPDEGLPLQRIITSIIERASDGNLKKARKVAEREGRDLLFGYFLHESVIKLVEFNIDRLRLLCTIALQGITLTDATKTDVNLRTIANIDFLIYSYRLLALRAETTYLQNRYFDGHPILFKFQADEIEWHVETIRVIAKSWKNPSVQPKKGRRKAAPGKGDILDRLDSIVKVFEESIDPIEGTKRLVAEAKAKALRKMGKPDQADEFLKPYLRRASKREESTGSCSTSDRELFSLSPDYYKTRGSTGRAFDHKSRTP